MAYDQTQRMLAIKTELGDDVAVLTSLEGFDALSKPFLFKIQFATDADPARVKKLLGTKTTLWMGRPGESVMGLERRPVSGHFSRLRRGMTTTGGVTEWYAEVVPALWFLTRTTDCRIFQEKSVPEIVAEVLKLQNVTSFEDRTTDSYPKLEYCVQYRETALNFISRLMEQVGIFYWHTHTESEHKLIFSDNNNNVPAAGWGDVPTDRRPGSAGIRRIDEEVVFRSGKMSLRDFNFETPTDMLEVDAPTTLDVQEMSSRELYDYPGLYKDKSAGRGVADLQMKQDEAQYHLLRGESGLAGMTAGLRFESGDPYIGERELVITEVHHEAQDYSHWTAQDWGGREPSVPFYDNKFVCIPKKTPFHPERVTRKPFVQGPQTAIVTGPSGEEIHTDKYGRVKVKFHWDRADANDETTSCWIRVSQGWAGQNWGQVHLPRIGHEVIVDFLEGDPDRPIVTGRVYNAKNMHPYALPDNKTQSGIKSNSSKGGSGSNEIRFEDKKGAEEIFVNAEHDLNAIVENNETRKVGEKGTGNRKTEIKNDETLTVGANKTTTVKGNFDETIKGTETRTVNGNVSETFMANEDRKVSGALTENVKGNVDQTILGAYSQKVTGGISITTPASITVTATSGWTLLAPGGTTTVDNKFFKTGLDDLSIYAFQLTHAAIQINACATLALSGMNNKIDIQNLKVEFGGFKFGNDGTEIEATSTAIKQGALNLVTFGFIALS